MIDVVEYNNLETWLSNLTPNTLETAYEVKITDVPSSHTIGTKIRSNEIYISITEIVSINSEFYVDVEEFSSCRNLIGITLPNNCVGIRSSGFQYCLNLKTIVFSNIGNVSYIWNGAFSNCNNLTSINIPDNITSIYEKTFENCNSLTSIEIPEGITSIGKQAFGNCRSLTSINIPKTVTSIGINAFSACSSLESIVVSPENPVYNSKNNCNSIIETASNELKFGCKSSIIPDGVISVGDRAFYGQTDLKQIKIPKSVSNIGEATFYNSGLEILYIYSEFNNLSIALDAFGDRYVVSRVKQLHVPFKDSSIWKEHLHDYNFSPTVEIISIIKIVKWLRIA